MCVFTFWPGSHWCDIRSDFGSTGLRDVYKLLLVPYESHHITMGQGHPVTSPHNNIFYFAMGSPLKTHTRPKGPGIVGSKSDPVH